MVFPLTPLEVCYYYFGQKSAKTLFCESKISLIKNTMSYLLKPSQTSNGVDKKYRYAKIASTTPRLGVFC